jgi:uncharacterized protein
MGLSFGRPDWQASGAAILKGSTYHARRGGPENAFRYRVDYLMWRVAPEPAVKPLLLNRWRFGLLSLSDRDHGRGVGSMTGWARTVALAQGLPAESMMEIWLLTQPRTLGYVFNPVSFWFFRDREGQVLAVLAEVNNTFGDRHSYFCALPGWQPIGERDRIEAQKVFHVSPFQEVAGTYTFRFQLSAEGIAIDIGHRHGNHGVFANLKGALEPLTDQGLARMLLRHPLGAMRVLGLIHWQAVRLKLKGAPYRVRPQPPMNEVTR